MVDQPPDGNLDQQVNNGLGPLCKPRGSMAVFLSVIITIISVVFLVRERVNKEGIHFLLFTAALITLSAVLGELPQRLCLLVFPDGAREQSPVETSEIIEREHKNLADGLAWGYYFGYLKLVLPKLEEQIAKSEQFRYEITKKKLFILLPQDCFTEDNIEDADDRVKWAGNLPEYKRNRGGIKARSYKHAVHRIEMPHPEGGVDKCHVVLEYATPLMNLYDMSKHADAPLSRQERDHQVVLFMRKLSYILEHCCECKGKYELVFLSETDTKKIADVVVGMYKDTKRCLERQLVFPDGAREQSPVETSEINEREHKNLADGLAWGYYFGYLKLVLPKLEEQIAKSEQFRYEITMKKLFILLPQDCFTEDNIEDADDRVKWAGNLPECKRNRGGIKARSYKHAVHLIEMPNPEGGVDKCHVILEYATPLMTLYDMSMSKLAALSDQERDHQVVLFMRELSDILEHCRECKGKYELVFLSETDTKKIADVVVGMYNRQMQVDAN